MAKNSDKPFKSIFRQVPKWQDLWFYQKSEVLYQMTYVFCERFLPQYGDRTVDQMVQAARSGKQNIVEGSEDGKTSTEMELKLLNVARASIGELRQDYEDFLKSRQLRQWTAGDKRFQPMQDFTKSHNLLSDYEPYFTQWSAEEMANVGLTLCFQVDTMMNKYMEGLEHTISILRQQLVQAQDEAALWKAKYEDLKLRAINAYNQKNEEIEQLKNGQ